MTTHEVVRRVAHLLRSLDAEAIIDDSARDFASTTLLHVRSDAVPGCLRLPPEALDGAATLIVELAGEPHPFVLFAPNMDTDGKGRT